MQTILELIIANWTTIISSGSAVSMGLGWLMERNGRKRDARDADVAFWTKTIEAQNAYIANLEGKIDNLEQRYENQISKLLHEVADLAERLQKYEPGYIRKITHTHKSESNA